MATEKNSLQSYGRRSEVCTAIRSARTGQGLTQHQLAVRADVVWRTIARIEAGAVPKDVTLARLEAALGIRLRPSFDTRTRTHGAALRELRIREGWTVRQLEERTDLSASQIRHAESGKHVPSGGWDALLDDTSLAQVLGFKDEQGLSAFVNWWMEGE